MLLLSATDLYKTYGLKTIFDHISLNIDSNDKIGLLGVNGTGKSTLLRILAGWPRPTAAKYKPPTSW